jgi:hypothetical protein
VFFTIIFFFKNKNDEIYEIHGKNLLKFFGMKRVKNFMSFWQNVKMKVHSGDVLKFSQQTLWHVFSTDLS